MYQVSEDTENELRKKVIIRSRVIEKKTLWQEGNGEGVN